MMRRKISFLLAYAAALTASPASFAQGTKLAAPIEQCIRENTPKVERAVDDLGRAVTFLVANVCAEPIAIENMRQAKLSNERRAKQWQDMCDEQKKNPAQKNEAFDACGMLGVTHIGFSGIDQYGGDDDGASIPTGASPAAATALASRLLLDLRLSHSKTGQPR